MNIRIRRLIVGLGWAKSGRWAKADSKGGSDTYWVFIGTFSNGRHTLFKLVIGPFSLLAGLATGQTDATLEV